MISIRKEIEASTIEDNNNVLKNSPHTLSMLTADSWNFPYTREQAAFPLSILLKTNSGQQSAEQMMLMAIEI